VELILLVDENMVRRQKAAGRGQKGKAFWGAGLGGWYFTFNYVYLLRQTF
jgi:hypothetical protein